MKNILPILVITALLAIRLVRYEDAQITFETPNNGVAGIETAANADAVLPEIQISFKPRKMEAIKLAEHFAKEFGMDSETLLCVLNQESGVESHDPLTGKLKCGDNGASCGIGQIKLETWRIIRKDAGWDTEDLRWNDSENIRTTAYGITHKWPTDWTGYRTCRDMGYKIK